MDISKVQDKNQIADAKLSDIKSKKAAEAAAAAKAKEAGLHNSGEIKQTTAEKVSWSPEASLAKEALETAKASPDVRTDKIAALKAQIAGGNYKVDPKALAEKMISRSLEEDLLTNTKGS